MTIKRALKTLQGYCSKHMACSDCPLSYHGESVCIVNTDMPVDWNIDKFFEKVRGEQE